MANKYEYVADKYCLWRKLPSKDIYVQHRQGWRDGRGGALTLTLTLGLAKLVG